ncbi:MAG: sigma-70 family RNA polymerase sigma factor [Candidatus Latescibacteria bacterium]|nr:sigma-70 family RNA polymerase sigma factor [Candidatus Latescibacterota bacterium]
MNPRIEEALTTLGDEVLVRKAQEDDDRAFGELVSRYETKVYSLALKMVRNPEDAEDVLQDTFLRAYRGIKSFKGNSTFSTWIYRITANSALMRLRKKQLPTVSIEDADEREAPVSIADWSPGPVDQLLNQELQQVMDEAIEALPAEFRQVFVLRDIEEISNAEVAEILDLSVAAVKSRLHRARLKVRNRLAAYFNENQKQKRAMGAQR